ncbi:MAG: hypothetical protein ABSA47_19600, partial [Verrucomicrobiota bacterium]
LGGIVVGGPLTWTGGNIQAAVQCNGGSVNVSSSSVVGFGGQLINTGTMTWTPNSGPRTGGSGGTVISNAASGIINVTLNGNNIDSYSYGYTTAFYNAGQINISGAGQTGSITDPFYNTGTLNIPSGTLSLTGGYTSTGSTLNFVISSTTSFGQLAVSGACELNNTTLGVTADGYAPSAGDSFPLITYGSETGIFSVFNLPPHANWQPNYGNSAFSLNVASLTPPWLTVQVVTPPVQIPNGFTLLMLGPPDYNYAIQGSTDLSTSGWENLATVYMVNSSFYYTDTAAGTTPFRFFRAVQHPPPLVRREPKGVSP